MQVLAQAEDVVDVCAPGEGEVDPFCEWLLDATGNTLIARGAGLISTGLRVVVILVLAYVLSRLARAAIARSSRTMERRIQARLDRGEARGTLDVERYRLRRFQRLAAITGVARGVVGVLVWFVALLAVVDALGINLQPILAGAGLAGIVIGFGAQQLVRDVLAGIAMLIEDQYGVGDWIQIQDPNGPVIGQVERVGLRATSFRDLDGVLWHTLNGSIERVGNLSQEWSRSTLDVPLALDADVPSAKAIIQKVATDLAEDPVYGEDIIGAPQIWGVQDFGPNGLSIRLVMPTKPMANWDINRQLRERLHHAFEQAGIRMPTQLVDVGGQRRGYPLLSREEDDGTRPPERRRRGLVPTDVGPLDRPERSEQRDGAAVEDRDPTVELRIERGREPRPD